MADDFQATPNTVGLSTKVEEDFVSPLTAIRGSLEILRDFDDLSEDERHRFIERALNNCARLEKSVEELSITVYAAGQQASAMDAEESSDSDDGQYTKRIHVLTDQDIIELDFSDYEFRNSEMVNAFFDVIDQIIRRTDQDWYFVLNQRDCRVWPEAWIAFAHRGKKVRVTHSKGTVRYAEYPDSENPDEHNLQADLDDPDFFASRADALARIEELKAGAS